MSADEISVSPVSLDAGGNVVVPINLSLSSQDFSALQFDVVLPKGITVTESDGYLFAALATDHITVNSFSQEKSHTMGFSQLESDENSTTYRCVIYSNSNAKLKSGDGAIIQLQIEADATANAQSTGYVKDTKLAASGGSGGATGASTTLQDASFTITVAGGQTPTVKPTITIDNQTRKYGEANPEFTWTVTEGTYTGTLQPKTSATESSPVGTYSIDIPTSDDYNFVPGKLTVEAAPLTISGGTYSIKQGDPLPTLVPVYTGFKNNETSETSGVLTEQPTLAFENGVTSTSAPGDYKVTVTGGAATNYDITRVDGTLTITAADAITVTAKSYEITYGDDLPTSYGYTITEGATLNSEPTITCDATADSGAGEYDINISEGSVSTFGATFVKGKLTIKKAPLTAKAKSTTRKEGQPNPTFEIEYSGFVKGETEANLDTKPTATTTAVETSEPGEYPITITAGVDKNYEITCEDGTLTVTDADAFTVTAKSYEITYGDDLPTQFEYVADDGVEGTPVITCEATATSGAGEYEIKLEKGTISNYKVTLVPGKLTIKKATLTATADNCSKQQGEANPDFTITYSGWKFSDDESVLTVAPTATAATDATTAPGTYDITVSGGEAANYEFSYVKGTLTISEADPLTVTAKSYEIFYGDDIPAFEFTSEGATVNGTPEITCEATSKSPVGEYPIVIKKGTVTNYNDTYVNGKLTIKKATLTAKVKDTSVEQGKATPTFEITYEGFKNGEDKSVLTKEPVATTTREPMSDIGFYDITLSGGEAQNYDFSYVNGKLEVTPPGLVTITVTNCDRYYGAANPTFTYTVSGGELEGEPTLACVATATSGVGDYEITIEKGTVSNLYTRLVSGTMTIKKTSLTVIADDATRDYYDENPTFTCSYSGFVNNETDEVLTTKPSYKTTATSSCDPGDYEITPYGAEADNYEIYYVSGTLTVVKTVRDDEGNLIVYDGENATLTSLGYDPVNDDGGVVVPDGVTQIADDAFDALSDEEKGQVNYVDLSNSTVTGITVDRESGLFEGFSENALILLPEGNNDGGEPNVVIGNTCRELVIDDEKEIILPADFTAQKVTYSRTLSAADEAYTTCLPFSQTSNEDVKFYELTSSTSDNLVFSEVATTEPNMPYLAVPTVASASLGTQTSTIVKSNTNLDGSEKTVTGYEMRGTQKRINRDDAMGFYILQEGNEWHPIGATSPATVYIPAYRAYIVATTGSAVRLFSIFDGENTTTIKSIKTINADGSEQWYDLNGRKLSGTPAGKGAYIMNGKKVITK